jgi:hypothetical protein
MMAIFGNAFPFVTPMSKLKCWFQAVYYINVPYVNDWWYAAQGT